jgi:hypothetical protein
MNQDILLSKIVPNATDTTWAQAYTTLNVYITLSIEKESGKSPVTPYGKELLEKLQREFFALDDKSLENIKKAVGNVSKTIEKGYRYSILVGAIVNNILYIVVASAGQVAIKRGEQTGIIATGVENELHGFSGKLEHDDIIIFETGDFTEKIPLESLSEYLSSKDVLQIAENITPLVHENSKGTESAIIIQYKDMNNVEHVATDDFEIGEGEQTKEEKEPEEKYIPENLWTKERHENRNIEELADDNNQEEEYEEPKKRRQFELPSFSLANRRVLILAISVVLIIILVGGILFQLYQKNQAQKTAEFNKVYDPIQEKFNEGKNLESLNKSLALDDFTATSKMVNEILSKYSKGSDEYTKLTELKSESESKISELAGGSSAKNVKEFLKPGNKIKSITAVSAKGGTLVLLDSQGEQVMTIDTNGTIKKTYDIKNSDKFISSDDKFIYTMGTSITSIDRGNGKVTTIIKDVKGDSFDIFGSNVYTLTNGDILKYKAPSYDPNSYFTDKPAFKNTPQDIGISGPIWVLETSGTVERFTKGKNDNVELSGLSGPIADNAKIYADPDNDNVYVMDVKNQRVVSFNEEGEYQTQYEGSFIKDATSFAIDEKNNAGYVVSKNTLYSFDL